MRLPTRSRSVVAIRSSRHAFVRSFKRIESCSSVSRSEVEYLDLTDYVGIAADITGLDEAIVVKIANLDLADSALHAPSAEFGGEEFYPDFVDKAAVLLVRLAKNHPLPDGNKRVAWVALRYFLILNGWE